MRYLVDTHALIWYLESNPMLSETARLTLDNNNNRCFISMASLWEMAIKVGLGRLELSTDFKKMEKLITGFHFEILAIEFEHVSVLSELPLHHNDPFDRIIIAQSSFEELTLITRDEKIRSYNIQTLW